MHEVDTAHLLFFGGLKSMTFQKTMMAVSEGSWVQILMQGNTPNSDSTFESQEPRVYDNYRNMMRRVARTRKPIILHQQALC